MSQCDVGLNLDEKVEGYELTDNYGWGVLSLLNPDL